MVENVQILIGSDFFARYLSGMTSLDNIELHESPGGYLIYGIIPHFACKEPVSYARALLCKVTTSETTASETEPYTAFGGVVDETLSGHKLQDLGTMGINPSKESPEDFSGKICFESTVKYDDGRYSLELTLKENFSTSSYKLQTCLRTQV